MLKQVNGSRLNEQNTYTKGIKDINLGRFDLEGLRQSPRLTKAFKVETSCVFTLSVAYFAHLIDFCSCDDATMSLYSIDHGSLMISFDMIFDFEVLY